MKKTTRRILALALSLALVCALATAVFADTVIAENPEPFIYDYDDIRMEHKIQGFETRARAVISFKHTSGAAITNENFTFSYSGYISYQYCREDQLRPENYVSGRRNDSREVRMTTAVIYTNTVPSGNVMIDAFMFFQTQFRTTHATIHHDNPDMVYVGII